MDTIERLTQHYQSQPPRLSFRGSEGTAIQTRVFDKLPRDEATKSINGIVVLRRRTASNSKINPVGGYCIVDACLDESGRSTPDALPLPVEMQNHSIEILVYVDHLDCIRMRAIGS